MNKYDDHLLLWVKIWVEIVTGAIIIISIASGFSMMSLGGWLALSAGTFWISYRIISAENTKRIVLNWQDWPFYIMIGLTLVSICIRPHSILDSYSYRLPQILLWIQEGHPWSIPNVDFRINQMPHIWPFLGTVFFLPFGERGIAIPNLISYLMLLGILKKFTQASNIPKTKSRWIILVFMTSPVIVMQAASNDNVLTSSTFLMIAIYFSLLRPLSTSSVSYSALSFALCCGIKPQYVVLAPLWVVWFFHKNYTTIRQLHWKVFVWLIPLVIICSPLPTFSINYFYYGSIRSPKVSLVTAEEKTASTTNMPDKEGTPVKIWEKPVQSYSRLTFALFALPINPLANRMTTWINKMAEKTPFFRFLNWHRQRIYPILIPESASLSFFATLALLIGIFRKKKRFRTFKWLALGSVIAMTLAIWIATPGDSGRSFIGYFMLMFPLAFVGLASVRKQVLMTWGLVCFAAGIMTIVINPSCPLWPAQAVIKQLPASWVINTDIQRYPIFQTDKIRSCISCGSAKGC